MKSKAKLSLLAAVVASAIGASQADASFNYDLRFAPGQGQTNNHSIVLNATGNYTLQLWGQITGDTDFTNDGWVHGYIGVASTQLNGGAIGASTMLGTANLALFTGSTNGVAANITNDGVGDWGSTNTSTNAGWLNWAINSPPPGVADAGPAGGVGQAIAGNPNGWEVLVATYVVNVSALGSGGETDFNVVSGLSGNIKNAALGTTPAVLVDTDTGKDAVPGATNTATQSGVAFVTVPEPASLGVLALGGLALAARRRRR